MKILKSVISFFMHFSLLFILLSLVIPKSTPPAFIIAGLILILVISIYLARKSYQLNSIFILDMIFKKKNSKNKSVKYSYINSDKKVEEIKPDIEIVYEKENGEISKRKIKILKNNLKYVKAFCFLRNDERTFLINRIKELKDLKENKIYKTEVQIWNYFDSKHTPLVAENNFIDEGYFYNLVKEPIIDVGKDFNIIYENIEFDAWVIRLGKTFNDKLFILIRNLDADKFAGLFVDKIKEMYSLETGEVINDPKKYFEEIYEEEYKKFLKKEEKKQKREKIYEFIDEHLELLKMLVYIAKSDGTINSKEKDILIETLEKAFPNIVETNKIIDKVSKDHLYFKSYQSFTHNAKKIIENYPEIDFLEFAEKIVSTQKNIHDDEEKILNYLSKIYNRDYQLHYEPQKKGQKTFNNEPCPYCNSTHTIKKGKRQYKNYTAQRYACQECGKIFSFKIEEDV